MIRLFPPRLLDAWIKTYTTLEGLNLYDYSIGLLLKDAKSHGFECPHKEIQTDSKHTRVIGGVVFHKCRHCGELLSTAPIEEPAKGGLGGCDECGATETDNRGWTIHLPSCGWNTARAKRGIAQAAVVR